MKIAIISITDQAKKISDKLYLKLQEDPRIIHTKQYHKNVKQAINESFNNFDCIIAIMASGIIIRSIAPHIRSKLTDPAVILLDDNANHAISLLSGHFGGANRLTNYIAEITKATPVITTSTDVNNKTGIDSIAKDYHMKLEKPENIRYINRALVDDRKPELTLDKKYSYIINDEIKKSYNIKQADNNKIECTIDKHTVRLTPRKIVMGIGSRKNIPAQKVEHAITEACKILEIPPGRIDEFATVDIKKDEKGIKDTVAKYDKKPVIISRDEIENFKNSECSSSDFVFEQFGIKGVCEPVSLIANDKNAHLIFKKTAYNGVTIAVSVS